MSTREIVLSDDAEAFLEAQVKTGAFTSADDVVEEALRRLADDVGAETDEDFAWLKEELQERLSDPRPPLTADEVRRRLDEQVSRRGR
jgi:putative addiction module CopG family antidote